jgi:hypothetical protein
MPNSPLLTTLQDEHRDLDKVITELEDKRYNDPLLINRLKKRKLLLKDQIATLESRLIPRFKCLIAHSFP